MAHFVHFGLIKYYEGLESVKSVYEDLLKDVRPHDDYLVISDIKEWIKLDREYFQDFTERRAKLNINIRLLLQSSDKAYEFKKYEQNYNEKIKILPEGTMLTTSLIIIPKKIVIHQLTPPIMAVVIENKSIINMQKEMFEIIWNGITD